MGKGMSNAEVKLRMARNALQRAIEMLDERWLISPDDDWIRSAYDDSAPESDDQEVPRDGP